MFSFTSASYNLFAKNKSELNSTVRTVPWDEKSSCCDSLALQTNLIAHSLSYPLSPFRSHALRHAQGGNTAWLGAQDPTLLAASVAVIQNHLGHLTTVGTMVWNEQFTLHSVARPVSNKFDKCTLNNYHTHIHTHTATFACVILQRESQVKNRPGLFFQSQSRLQ
jgi:hypothetical protein